MTIVLVNYVMNNLIVINMTVFLRLFDKIANNECINLLCGNTKHSLNIVTHGQSRGREIQMDYYRTDSLCGWWHPLLLRW